MEGKMKKHQRILKYGFLPAFFAALVISTNSYAFVGSVSVEEQAIDDLNSILAGTEDVDWIINDLIMLKVKIELGDLVAIKYYEQYFKKKANEALGAASRLANDYEDCKDYCTLGGPKSILKSAGGELKQHIFGSALTAIISFLGAPEIAVLLGILALLPIMGCLTCYTKNLWGFNYYFTVYLFSEAGGASAERAIELLEGKPGDHAPDIFAISYPPKIIYLGVDTSYSWQTGWSDKDGDQKYEHVIEKGPGFDNHLTYSLPSGMVSQIRTHSGTIGASFFPGIYSWEIWIEDQQGNTSKHLNFQINVVER
jgi:hypothetical protein